MLNLTQLSIKKFALVNQHLSIAPLSFPFIAGSENIERKPEQEIRTRGAQSKQKKFVLPFFLFFPFIISEFAD